MAHQVERTQVFKHKTSLGYTFIKSVCACVRLWQESKYHKSMIQSDSGSEANKRASLEQSPFTFLVEYYVATPHPKDRMYVRACDCVCVF